ncbi:DUF1501 domain-containing protein [Paenibacillus chartarius]|uniref:DUF1501 domain-containing protein n=1 Tax=Paenibacillus chartarius TaxID=747481 RepID=A0ABV6DUF6_9BACL
MSRREFILAGSALLGTFFIGGAPVLAEVERLSFDNQSSHIQDRVLVVVQLTGGNDGINTIIPFGQGAYYDARPTLQLKEHEVLLINGALGFHPSLKGFQRLYQQGKLAIVQGVGYPKPDLSHFRSMEIWQTAEPESMITSGWLGRYMESLDRTVPPLFAAQIGGNTGMKAFDSNLVHVPIIQSISSFHYRSHPNRLDKKGTEWLHEAFTAMYQPQAQEPSLRAAAIQGKQACDTIQALQALPELSKGQAVYPDSGFAKDLQTVVRMLAGRSGTKVFYTQLDGFDDHADEKEQHAILLKELDESLSAFYDDLKNRGLHERVVTVVFSEFGRRVRENSSKGTDHGTAAPMFVIGGKVKGGLYGEYPSLSNLVSEDLKYEVDFRSVYYTLIDKWLRGDAKSVLGRSYETLAFL